MNPHLAEKANSLLNTLHWENETREKQLRRAARELHRLQREREKMVEETVILETETQEMRKEITALTCYARKLEEKLSCADEDLRAEMKNTEVADVENNLLLQTTVDLQMELEAAYGESARYQSLVKDADQLRDEYKADAEQFYKELKEKEAEMFRKLKEREDFFNNEMLIKEKEFQAKLEEQEQQFKGKLEEKEQEIMELQEEIQAQWEEKEAEILEMQGQLMEFHQQSPGNEDEGLPSNRRESAPKRRSKRRWFRKSQSWERLSWYYNPIHTSENEKEAQSI